MTRTKPCARPGGTSMNKQQEWQPIETAPKDGENFMAWDERAGCILFTMHWSDEDARWFTDYEQWSGAFTHWMPLPEPPK